MFTLTTNTVCLLGLALAFSTQILCRDVKTKTNDQVWPALGQNIKLNDSVQFINEEKNAWGSPKSTTAWPKLGADRYQPFNNGGGQFQPVTPSYYGPWRKPDNKNSSGTAWGQNNNWSNVYQNNDNNKRPEGQGTLYNNASQAVDTTYKAKPSGASSGELTDNDLRQFSEKLLNQDKNNAAKYVVVNYQKKTTSRSPRDEAPLPLLSIQKDAYQIPSIQKLLTLHNNYIVQSNTNEDYTSQEKKEENDFLNVIINTPVFQELKTLLISQGKISSNSNEFQSLIHDIWFNMYARGEGRIGSSGFEHVFLAEIKKDKVSGLHNWLYFAGEESKNQLNYLGYMKIIDLGNKGSILKYHFTFHGIDKPVGAMFIGTSPELEMALYSTCFLLRADRVCPMQMNGHRFVIRTFTYKYRGKNLIGSAFPEI